MIAVRFISHSAENAHALPKETESLMVAIDPNERT
jgi:hypothetical protein